MAVVEILIPLLNEGTPVSRPARADWLGGDRYRILGDVPPGEEWAFQPGAVVIARKKKGLIHAVEEEGDDEAFWAEHDPYGDRFGTPIRKRGCATAVVVAIFGYALYRFLISVGLAFQIPP